MYISRVVIRNYRNFEMIDVPMSQGVTCLVGENNTGKSNFLYAIRLAIDANLSSTYRVLTEHDIHSSADFTKPNHVVISVEFSDFHDKVNEAALVGLWQIIGKPETARLTYRYLPRQSVQDSIISGERTPEGLSLEDYHWEITGGGDKDPSSAVWNDRIGSSVKFSDLQQFLVVILHALRDVTQDLRQSRLSPLSRLLDASEIPVEEKEALVDILKEANEEISKTETINQTGKAIDSSFRSTVGEAFDIAVRLGMADPTFSSISRSLTVLLSNAAISDFEPYRNGLGLNNLLYISMLIESFEKRIKTAKHAGQLLLIEEPEAHLHPQLQRALFDVLQQKSFQSILSTHSTHITSHASLKSMVLLTNSGTLKTHATAPALTASLASSEIADLERYLDATRSTLLYARKVILVEGPAELFVIPPLVKRVLNVDLDRLGISVVPIHGAHFKVYAKLFSSLGMSKKCAIIADGDLALDEQGASGKTEEDVIPIVTDLQAIANDFVSVFQCQSTFEIAITQPGTLLSLSRATEEIGAKKLSKMLVDGNTMIVSGKLSGKDLQDHINDLGMRVLIVAKRVGKARFAQILSKHLNDATTVPKYISDAIAWLIS